MEKVCNAKRGASDLYNCVLRDFEETPELSFWQKFEDRSELYLY